LTARTASARRQRFCQKAALFDDRELSAVALDMAALLGELHEVIEDVTPDEIEVGA
jgi:hypothetical protein